MMTNPVKMLCRNLKMVMNIVMTMMKVIIAMKMQMMMMKTISVFVNCVIIVLLRGD